MELIVLAATAILNHGEVPMVIDDVGTWVVEQDDGPCATENKCLWLKKTKYLFTCTFFDESSRPNIEVDVDFLDTGPRTSASRAGATEQGVQGSNHLGTRVPNDPASYLGMRPAR